MFGLTSAVKPSLPRSLMEAVDELKLEKGKTAYAIIKATSVMVGVD
jgi:hypothetical protein